MQDVALLFDNCYLYNRPETWVYGLAVQAEKWFDAEWGKEAFAGSVARRPLRPTPPPAPLAAAAPRPSGPPRKPAAPPKAKRAAPKAAPPRRPAGPKAGGGGGVARTKSVNSYRNYQTLPADKQAALAEALQDEATLAAKMDGVVGILQSAGELPTNEDGEVELDLRSVHLHACSWGPLRGLGGGAKRVMYLGMFSGGSYGGAYWGYKGATSALCIRGCSRGMTSALCIRGCS